jgi:hypothetical protein
MAKLQLAVRVVGFAALAGLAGCNGGPGAIAQPPPGAINQPPPVAIASDLYPPWTLLQSPEEIALRWYPDATPSSAANQIAHQHCGAWNKSAVLVSDTRDGSAELAEYRCR